MTGEKPPKPPTKRIKPKRGPTAGVSGYKPRVPETVAKEFKPKPKSVAIDLPDPFKHGATTDPREIGVVERSRYESDILKIEWAVKWPHLTPMNFLMEKKMLNFSQADHLIQYGGGVGEWQSEKSKILDKLTEGVVKRHIDLIAEVQETHIKASKIGLAKAVEFLTKMNMEPARGKDGKIIMDHSKDHPRPVYKGMRSIDLMNCMSAIEKAQQIYRRALGLPNEEAGLQQVLEKIQQMQVHNTQINIGMAAPIPETEERRDLKKKVEGLSYDDIMTFVRAKREDRKTIEAQKVEAPSQAVDVKS
mgnify:CR=1 FL=1